MHITKIQISLLFPQSEQHQGHFLDRILSPVAKSNIWATTWQNQQSECAPSEDSDQPGHPPSLIRVFAVRMKKAWVLSYPLSAQRRLWSDTFSHDKAQLKLAKVCKKKNLIVEWLLSARWNLTKPCESILTKEFYCTPHSHYRYLCLSFQAMFETLHSDGLQLDKTQTSLLSYRI